MSPDRVRVAALGATVVGFVLLIAGVVGTLVSDDGAPRVAPQPTATPEAPAEEAAEAPAEEPPEAPPEEPAEEEPEAPPEEPAEEEEGVEEFYASLGEAIRTGDADFLFARLHPEVLELYGEDQCRASVERLDNPDYEIEVIAVGEARRFLFGKREGLKIPVADTIPVEIVQRAGDQEVEQTAHVARVDGELRWFTDCGDPI